MFKTFRPLAEASQREVTVIRDRNGRGLLTLKLFDLRPLLRKPRNYKEKNLDARNLNLIRNQRYIIAFETELSRKPSKIRIDFYQYYEMLKQTITITCLCS